VKPLAVLRAQLAAGEFEFTQHALKRVVERNISNAEIREAGTRAVVIARITLATNMAPVACCWASPSPAARCIFRSPGSPGSPG